MDSSNVQTQGSDGGGDQGDEDNGPGETRGVYEWAVEQGSEDGLLAHPSVGIPHESQTGVKLREPYKALGWDVWWWWTNNGEPNGVWIAYARRNPHTSISASGRTMLEALEKGLDTIAVLEEDRWGHQA